MARWLHPHTKTWEWWLFTALFVSSALLELYVRVNGLFQTHPYIDNPMHVLWGATFFVAFTRIFNLSYRWGFIGVFIWQMLWEGGEQIGDLIINQPAYMQDIFFWDGVKDTILNLLGAGLAFLALKFGKKK